MGTKQTNGHTKNGKSAPEAKPSKKQIEARASSASLDRGSKRKLESDRPSKARLEDGNGKSSAKDNAKLQALIAEGKQKGFLTYDEVNDAVPQDAGVVADQMDDALGMLGDEDIEIVDAATQVKIAPKRIVEEDGNEKNKQIERTGGGAPTPAKEEDADGYYSKSNDPVRMYLRKMGSVSLLTREGEVEIAKRIEQGEHAILGAILNSPVAVREIIDLGDKLRKRKIRVKEIIRDVEEEDREFDEEEADRRILRLIDKVKHLDKVAQDLTEQLETCAQSRKKSVEAELSGVRQKMVETLEEMRLNKKTIDRVVMKLRQLIQKIERAESGNTDLEKRAGIDMDTLRKEARAARGDANEERKFKRKYLGVTTVNFVQGRKPLAIVDTPLIG